MTDQADAEVFTTLSDGSARIEGLEDGEYDLIETVAPVGFVLLNVPIHIVIDSSAINSEGLTQAQIYDILTNTVSVENTPDSQLPSTGGVGTYVFYIIGSIFVIVAAVIIVLSFRKRKSNN